MSIIADLPISLIVLCSGLGLILIGLWGMLTQRNMIRMIIGFSLTDTGIHMVMVSIGYVTGGTAPIINDAVPMADAVNRVVDPVPSALVLTAIVIGLGVTAVMLSYAVRIYKSRNTLMIDECTESKW
jgi:multicomponent Na+:H+ antiporter subunit C